MIYNQIKTAIKNIAGWRTNKKIVVIESDDWGSIRIPSKDVFNKLITHGYSVNHNPYDKFDTLESNTDIDELSNVLSSYRDRLNGHPVITTNFVVANPDFDKIQDGNYNLYLYEKFTDTYNRYENYNKTISSLRNAINLKLFFPQFHAREHLNVYRYMNALRDGDIDVQFFFQNRVLGSISKKFPEKGNFYVEATNFNCKSEKEEVIKSYIDGLSIFRSIFGFESKSLIPTNYIWSSDFDKSVSNNGIKYFQGARNIIIPNEFGKKSIKNVTLGETNKLNQLYLVRNCFFEPTSDLFYGINNTLTNCLKEIQIAFLLRKPAIISTHRINYVGRIDNKNRSYNVSLLNQLLAKILKNWPDVIFLNSIQLAELISLDDKFNNKFSKE